MIWNIRENMDLLLTILKFPIKTLFKPHKMEILIGLKLRNLFKKSKWLRSIKSNNKLLKKINMKSLNKKKKPQSKLHQRLQRMQRKKSSRTSRLLLMVALSSLMASFTIMMDLDTTQSLILLLKVLMNLLKRHELSES